MLSNWYEAKLMERNGAAKSTALSAIARLLSYQGGRIKYANDQHVGIASQKDVLWDDLSCKQVSLSRRLS